MVEVIVARLGLDSGTNSFVVILQEKQGDRVLPIWIGRAEAESIGAHLQGMPRHRPMTHDLARALIVAPGGVLARVQVTRVHNNTFFAEMHVVANGTTHVVDARPSDSIAIALRCDAPIYAAEELLAEVELAEDGGEAEADPGGDAPEAGPEFGAAAAEPAERSAEQLQRYLAQLRPEDFGKFRL